MTIELDPIEQRVIGSLLEKERTVPDTYPMTLNGLRTACNQSSGRDPILALSETEVQAALDRLRPRGLTRVLHPSHGARQPKFRQVLDEVLALEDGERAVLTLLLLRGAQTPGELRSRAERLHAFGGLGEVETALTGLADREEPLVHELDRQPGQKERRWRHRLGPMAEPVVVAPPPRRVDAGPAGGPEARDQRVVEGYGRVASAYAAQFVEELDGKPFDRWLLERIVGLAEDGPIADVGCGPGHIAFHLATAGGAVTGFDLTPAMVAEARRRFPELTVEVADLHHLPPVDGGWAAVTAWYSLVHLTPMELPGAIAAMAGALRPGGHLAVAMHEGTGDRRLDEWFDQPVALDFCFHARAAVVAAFAAAGLTDLEWFVRGPTGPDTTDRLYVLGRRPG